jgi:tripartite-type tricarboxylate transporter receptor subunit TctC
VLKLNARINMALQSAVLKERYAAIDAEPTGGTPEAFAAYVKKEKRGAMSSENPAPRLTRG